MKGWEKDWFAPGELSGMNALALDTTTDRVSLAILKDGVPAACRHELIGREANRSLLGLLEELLSGAGLDIRELHLLVAARGPGSFTGTRIGLAMAFTFARAAGIPLAGVDTLRLLAAQANPVEGQRFHSLLNCARNEVYHAPYVIRDGLPHPGAEIRLDDIGALAQRIGAEPVLLKRLSGGITEEPYAGLNMLPARDAGHDGLRLLGLGLRDFLDAPAGSPPPAGPIYIKSEAFRTWRPPV
ncbi:MAG: tRNA (adenosine(37)-N6)-threonylcarbamoyltransferase complex dimerization subunit type 1 TsaB [Deltaproteobacteria bacterium]|nr:tRNA (adenosine(37)-N6)-threonylcarbamoyltransferase complex dimerization subunit type 1 TsaB [Deltaproteobacteria bacterium]